MLLDRILGGAALIFLVASGVQTWRLDRAQSALADEQKAWAEERLRAADAARQMADEFRAKERDWQSAKTAAEVEHAKRLQVSETRARAAAAERDRLRDAYSAFARGPSEPAEDSLAAARQRAETLGLLLAKADGRAERDARELEALNEEKRLLLESWPK